MPADKYKLNIREASLCLKVPYKTIYSWRADKTLNFPCHQRSKSGSYYYYLSELRVFKERHKALFKEQKPISISKATKILKANQRQIIKWRKDPGLKFPFHQFPNRERFYYYENELVKFKKEHPELFYDHF